MKSDIRPLLIHIFIHQTLLIQMFVFSDVLYNTVGICCAGSIHQKVGKLCEMIIELYNSPQHSLQQRNAHGEPLACSYRLMQATLVISPGLPLTVMHETWLVQFIGPKVYSSPASVAQDFAAVFLKPAQFFCGLWICSQTISSVTQEGVNNQA